jgi:hypothetical protein
MDYKPMGRVGSHDAALQLGLVFFPINMAVRWTFLRGVAEMTKWARGDTRPPSCWMRDSNWSLVTSAATLFTSFAEFWERRLPESASCEGVNFGR